VVVVAIKELLFRMVNRLGRNANSTAIQTDAWHHRTDAFTSIAAFIGISIALLGGPRWQSADAWAALFACVLIGANGWRLFYPALREVLDTAPRGEIVEQVRTTAAQVPGVREIDKCFVRKMGLEFYVDLHIGVDENMTVRDGHEVAHDVKDAIRRAHPGIADVLVHIEPA
jgi:cation diffusion facilitator family transporter